MKALKISIVIIVVAAIAFFIALSVMDKDEGIIVTITSIFHTKTTEKTNLPENQFAKRIESEIDSLKKIPDNKFSNNLYKEIGYRLDDYYKKRRLGNDSLANEQRKVYYTSNLFAAYSEKFISQTFYVFNSSDWDAEDLDFIRSEYQILQKSPLLEKNSPVDKKFIEIQAIFSKYDEIEDFIASCRNFRFLETGLSDRFPIWEVKDMISQAVAYRNAGLGNQYVNKCTRIHDALSEIPTVLFQAHVRYLDNKISQWSNKYQYPRFNSHSDYVSNLNQPLRSEIAELDNDIYKATNFESEHYRLEKKWSDDNGRAYSYKYPTR